LGSPGVARGGGAPPAAGAPVTGNGTPGLMMPVTPAESSAMAAAASSSHAGAAGAAAAAAPLPWVRKWVRTKRAILFRLSNHTVQVCFIDGVSLLLQPPSMAAGGSGGAGAAGLTVVLDGQGRRLLYDTAATLRAATLIAHDRRGTGAAPPGAGALSPWSARLASPSPVRHGSSAPPPPPAPSDAETVAWDLGKRMRYVRDVLQQLMLPGAGAPAPAAGADGGAAAAR
jgi:hypothetical protein